MVSVNAWQDFIRRRQLFLVRLSSHAFHALQEPTLQFKVLHLAHLVLLLLVALVWVQQLALALQDIFKKDRETICDARHVLRDSILLQVVSVDVFLAPLVPLQ